MTPLRALRSHLAAFGPTGEQWLDSLPDLLDRAARTWGFQMAEPLAAGPWSVVFDGTRDGARVIAKVAEPSVQLAQQAEVLRMAEGRGYAKLLDADLDLGLLLLEPLGAPAATELGRGEVPGERTFAEVAAFNGVVVESLKRAWELPLEATAPVTRETNKAAQLGRLISEAAGRHDVAQHRVAIDRALLYAHQRQESCDPRRHVVCHGDPHLGNLLAVPEPREGAESGYVWVDPDGFRCEPEYDLGVVARDANDWVLSWSDPVVTLRQWCAELAALADADAEAVWQWAFIERVCSGLYLMDHQRAEEGRPFLEAATHLMSFRAA